MASPFSVPRFIDELPVSGGSRLQWLKAKMEIEHHFKQRFAESIGELRLEAATSAVIRDGQQSWFTSSSVPVLIGTPVAPTVPTGLFQDSPESKRLARILDMRLH